MSDQTELNKQQEKQQGKNTYTQNEIYENLNNMEQWDLQENQTVEERRELEQTRRLREFEQNTALVGTLKNFVRPVSNVTNVTNGSPTQEVAPAKVSRKEQRRRNKETKIAKKTNPLADYRSYRVAEQLKKLNDDKMRSFDEFKNSVKENSLRTVLKAYCTGYKTNSNNEPLNENELLKKEGDHRFMSDYISGDYKKREKHLQRITNEVLNIDLKLSDFSDESFLAHPIELKQKIDKISAFKEVYNDKINEPFFENLTPYERATIENLILVRFNHIDDMSKSCLIRLRIDYDGTISKNDDDVTSTIIANSWQINKNREGSNAGMISAAEKEVNRLVRESLSGIRNNPYQADYFDSISKVKEKEEAIANYRSLISGNVDAYSANREYIDKLYQKLYHGIEVDSDMSAQLEVLKLISIQESTSVSIGSKYIIDAVDEVRRKITMTKEHLLKERESIESIIRHLLYNEALSKDVQEFKDDMDFMERIKDLSHDEQEKQKITREVKKINEVADYESFLVAQKIKKTEDSVNNSVAPFATKAVEKNVDIRILQAFCSGYQCNGSGEPISKNDDNNRDNDISFLNDYLSCDYNKRKGRLEIIVDELLSIPTDKEFYSREKILKNIPKYKRISDKFTCIENIIKDKINKPFFDGLEFEKREKLNYISDVLGKNLPQLIMSYAATKCIDLNSGEIISPSAVEGQKAAQPIAEAAMSKAIESNPFTLADKKTDALLKKNLDNSPYKDDKSAYAALSFGVLTNIGNMMNKDNNNYANDEEFIDMLYNKLSAMRKSTDSTLEQIDALIQIRYQISNSSVDDKEHLLFSISEKLKELIEFKNLLQEKNADMANILKHLLTNENTRYDKKYLDELKFEQFDQQDGQQRNEQQIAELKLRAQQTVKVRKINKTADYRSLRAANAARDLLQRKTNSLQPFDKNNELTKHNIDGRMALTLCIGYKTDESGNPASEEDQKNKETDANLLNDYIYGGEKEREPHLIRILDEMLKTDLEEFDYSDDYILEHTATLKEKFDKLLYVDSLIKENSKFFNKLSKEKKEKLDIMTSIATDLSSYIKSRELAHGYSTNTGVVIFHDPDRLTNTITALMQLNNTLQEIKNKYNIDIKIKGLLSLDDLMSKQLV